MSFISSAKQYLLNLPGRHTGRKIVVIHSDDWGSIRMPSLKIREKLDQHQLIKANDPYSRYDTLASAEDLEALFKVLQSVKDRNGNPAVITANCVLANPDFEKIKADNFEVYHYEDLDQSFGRYRNEKALNLWREGKGACVFHPQFHGREHVNVPFWMRKLKEGHQGVRAAFETSVFGVNFLEIGQDQWNFQRAWDILDPNPTDFIELSIVDGLKLFHDRFGYNSETAIAPNYTWSPIQEKLLANHGVRGMQGILKQRVPMGYKKKYRYVNRLTNLTDYGAISYQRRNVFFEPSLEPGIDYVTQALKRIDIAFRMGKPAIVGSHRINFVGGLMPINRERNLKALHKLLHGIMHRWPEAEFKCS